MLRGVNVPDLLERGLILSSELHGHILEDNLFSHQISQLVNKILLVTFHIQLKKWCMHASTVHIGFA